MVFQAATTEWERQLCRLDQEAQRKWLYRVLKHKAIDRWRTSRREFLIAEPAKTAASGPPQETYHRALSSIVLQRCWARMRQMPEIRQRVAFLRWSEEWSSREIADLLGINQSTVRVHLMRARDELAEEIGSQVSLTDSGEDTDEGVT
jgi:RNA polymerase sigma-70 factor (ECF subfamily)